ncbi:MAG: 30S ribosomal protein S18 [Candidatus Blackburnbacteria bacterium RIFCSPHIGHO2_12_FULL_41_13b]|uniref:Small ribosomal subunit protein bS18 n=1 Tax=Candidatus Blackburnbacteria bacterium RIFCSPHIGHO2_12_FULL_41_13b TaxID=1797517 RepID=A0A1G1V6I1_9BACT|nr:MAG: 30S ribosomal protein S18 [Candidatus Blackburnbacteria bacterium RIFCSPHIGHO2_12_FULL_41_13b]
MAKKKDKDKNRPQREKRKPVNDVCPFCASGKAPDYKNWVALERFVSERRKIWSRARSGVCAKHQRALSREIKRARHLALLPFSQTPY